MSRAHWWEGRRGEAYVLVQAVLFLLLAFGPRSWPGWPAFLPLPGAIGRFLAIALLVIGCAFVVSGVAWLRSNLTPLPYPRECGTLIQTGPFRLVRHPMYSGGILMALGWSLLVEGLLTFVHAVLLFVLFDMKSRREEAWLKERFPSYDAYQAHSRRLIPFVY